MCLPILMMMLCSTKAYVSVVNRLFGTLFLNDKWMLLDLVTSFSRPCFDFAGNSWFCRGLIYVILIQFWMLKVQVCVSWFWIKCVPLAHPLLIQSCFWNYFEIAKHFQNQRAWNSLLDSIQINPVQNHLIYVFHLIN